MNADELLDSREHKPTQVQLGSAAMRRQSSKRRRSTATDCEVVADFRGISVKRHTEGVYMETLDHVVVPSMPVTTGTPDRRGQEGVTCACGWCSKAYGIIGAVLSSPPSVQRTASEGQCYKTGMMTPVLELSSSEWNCIQFGKLWCRCKDAGSDGGAGRAAAPRPAPRCQPLGRCGRREGRGAARAGDPALGACCCSSAPRECRRSAEVRCFVATQLQHTVHCYMSARPCHIPCRFPR